MNEKCMVHPPEYDEYDWDVSEGMSYKEVEEKHSKFDRQCPCNPKIKSYSLNSGKVIGLIIHRPINE